VEARQSGIGVMRTVRRRLALYKTIILQLPRIS